MSLRLQIPPTHGLDAAPHPICKAHSLLLTALERSKENLFIPGVSQENLEPNPPPRPLN